MADEVIMSQLLKDLTFYDEGTSAEELRQSLNAIIAKHKLHVSVVISLVARLSAGCIHLAQKYYNAQNADVVVEEDFQNMLTAYLTSIDMESVSADAEKVQREKIN